MITERTLRNWRKDALQRYKFDNELVKTTGSGESVNIEVLNRQEMNQRILRLTQELLDQHLMKGK
jgi:hypothetical protein